MRDESRRKMQRRTHKMRLRGTRMICKIERDAPLGKIGARSERNKNVHLNEDWRSCGAMERVGGNKGDPEDEKDGEREKKRERDKTKTIRRERRKWLIEGVEESLVRAKEGPNGRDEERKVPRALRHLRGDFLSLQGQTFNMAAVGPRLWEIRKRKREIHREKLGVLDGLRGP